MRVLKTTIGEPLTLADGVTIPLSRAVSADGFIFVSGQLGIRADGNLVTGGVREQTRQAILNIEAILEKAGATLNDVIKVTGWLVREEDFSAFNDTYGTYFDASPPARSMVVSKLLVPGALVEIEAIAVRQT